MAFYATAFRIVAASVASLLLACGSGSDPDSAPNSAPSPISTTLLPQPTPPILPTGCIAPADGARGGELILHPWIDGTLERPVAMAQPPGEDSTWFIVEQRGTIQRVDASGEQIQMSLALDWRGVVVDPVETDSAETGLLGIAFHPDYPEDRRVYVYATFVAREPEACPRIVVAELTLEGGVLDPNPERLLLEHETNCVFNEDGTFQSGHNAGTLHFDPVDGTLVVGIGDLARRHLAQDRSALEGKLLRLHIDAEVADDAPLAGIRVQAEIVAVGLRNPWKWSFDRATGEIWLGDVGKGTREEINRIEPGGNYGWPIFEAELCESSPCALDDHDEPILSYSHGRGCAVVAGYVYRGRMLADLHGTFLFADWCAGSISALEETPDGFRANLLADYGRPISSFAEGNDGELYVVDHSGSVLRVAEYRLTDPPEFPALLSETGCTAAGNASQPAPHLVPYEINVPFWSDGATKRRWISLPPGERIRLAEDGDFIFPPGTVLMKEFVLDGRPVETRLLMHHALTGWRGYSYAWDGDDATLVGPFGELRIDETDWLYPGREECTQCHTERAGHALGLEWAQLDRTVIDESGMRIAQLDRLSELGLVERGSFDPAEAPPLPRVTAKEPARSRSEGLESAARAYLHVNCSPCHRPGAKTYFPPMDLRASTKLADTGLCDAEPQRHFPGTDLRLLAPGAPDRSVALLRLREIADQRMPPLASLELDVEAGELIREWVLDLESCPLENG